MVGGQGQEDLVNQHDMLEVVDDAFAIEEVTSGGQPVPVQALGPAQVSRPAGNVGNGNDLLEGDDLDGRNDEDDVDMAEEQGGKEAPYHYERPDHPCDEGLLLFLVLARRRHGLF